MRQRTTAEQRTRRPVRRQIAGAVVLLLAIAMPVLLAFTRIDAPATPHELRRVEAAMFPERSGLSEAARMFYGATIPESALQSWPRDRQAITVGARLTGMLALFAISALVYLLLAQVRGRVTGVVGSLSLAALPPVAATGYLLRPETGATMFGMLGVVLFVGLPAMLQRRRGLAALISQGCLISVVGVLFGLAMAIHNQAWIYLGIPALALLLSVLSLVFLWPRAIRGRPFGHWPFRAAARRYGPWMCGVLICSAMALLVLTQAGGNPDMSTRPPAEGRGVLPGGWWAPVFWGVAGVGALRMGYGVSLRIQRLRRVRPDTVLFVFVAVMMMQYAMGDPGFDRLPAAVAMACLLGEGVVTATVMVIGWRRRP